MSNITKLCRTIESLINEMRDLTLQAGVPVHTFNQIMEVDHNLTEEDLESRLEFLQKTKDGPYWGVLSIWRLLTPETWKRYEEFGETQLREQKLLKDARLKLRKVWRKRYGEKEPSPVEGFNQGSSA